MIRLKCPACGHGLQAREEHAGRKSRCPKCSRIIEVPTPPATDPKPAPQIGEMSLKERPGEQLHSEPASPLWDTPEVELPQTKAPKGLRRHPWLLDILLYPSNQDGLLTVGAVGAMTLLANLLAYVPLPYFGHPRVFASVLVIGYLACYLAECIRDCADGGTRAPGMLFGTFDFQDGVLQVGDLLALLVGLSAPAGIYALARWTIDPIFWTLAGAAAFCLPMGLLSVVLFDSTSAVNPKYWAPALVFALLPYLGLLASLAILVGSTAAAVSALQFPLIGEALSSMLIAYVAMICAHLLGRFYFRYEKKIGWGI
jgi:hypothetical protein